MLTNKDNPRKKVTIADPYTVKKPAVFSSNSVIENTLQFPPPPISTVLNNKSNALYEYNYNQDEGGINAIPPDEMKQEEQPDHVKVLPSDGEESQPVSPNEKPSTIQSEGPPIIRDKKNLNDLIVQAEFKLDEKQLTKKIIGAFNKTLPPNFDPMVHRRDWHISKTYELPVNAILLATQKGLTRAYTHDGYDFVKNPEWFAPTITVLQNTKKKCHYFNMEDQCFGSDSQHVIIVGQGQYALARVNTIYQIFAEGVHVISANAFKFDKLVSVNNTYIKYGNKHILNVKAGLIACVNYHDQPYMLPAGTHAFETDRFEFTYDKDTRDLSDENEKLITHFGLTRLKLAYDDVAIIQGKELIFKKPYPNNLPIYLRNPNEKVLAIVSTLRQTVEFPFKIVNNQYAKHGPLNFSSADGIKVALKFTMEYELRDVKSFSATHQKFPANPLDSFWVAGFIQNTAFAHLATAIQGMKIKDNLILSQVPGSNKTASANHYEIDTLTISTIKNTAKTSLGKELAGYGIILHRLIFKNIQPTFQRKVEIEEINYDKEELSEVLSEVNRFCHFFSRHKPLIEKLSKKGENSTEASVFIEPSTSSQSDSSNDENGGVQLLRK